MEFDLPGKRTHGEGGLQQPFSVKLKTHCLFSFLSLAGSCSWKWNNRKSRKDFDMDKRARYLASEREASVVLNLYPYLTFSYNLFTLKCLLFPDRTLNEPLSGANSAKSWE